MLLTIIEIAVFMAAAAIIGVALGWVLRGTLGREQAEISDLRAQIRQLKKTSRESQGATAKSESAAPATTTAKAVSEPAPKAGQAAPKPEAKKTEANPESNAKKSESKAVGKAGSKPGAESAPRKASAKTGNKKAAARKSQAEREADQAAGRTAFAEVVERIGGAEQQDNLTKVYGIGKRYEAMLNDLGITAYSQVAKLRKADLKTLAAALGVLDDRIETEDWVGSARKLAKDAK